VADKKHPVEKASGEVMYRKSENDSNLSQDTLCFAETCA